MRRSRTSWTVPLALCFFANIAQAEVGIIQRADGSSARITDLGNGIGMISDPHEPSSPLPLSPAAAVRPAGPHGDVAPSTVIPFGSPAPPGNLTPTPAPPFDSNRSLPPTLSAPSSNSWTKSGRIGR
ncbi:MAG: hypothetical protein GDA67_15365 [Nitrospira sp. CR1.3]|nr:hypothetical protein [Nitrospira sp. CR1.3]